MHLKAIYIGLDMYVQFLASTHDLGVANATL